MSKLNKNEIEFITQCLRQGKHLPDSYRYTIPFETKKEYELTYKGKEREEDILADTMAVPLSRSRSLKAISYLKSPKNLRTEKLCQW